MDSLTDSIRAERAAIGYGHAVNDERHIRVLLAEVDRLTARVAELERASAEVRTAPPQAVATHTSCSPSTPEPTCARIAAWIRREADGLLLEMADQRPAEESAHRRGEWDAMTDIADAIERGDWRDQPADPRPSADRVSITPALFRRIEALGFVAGSEEPVGWLVGKVEALAVEQGKRRAADAVLSEIGGWCLTYGAALKPGGGDSDTFGDGMRAAKDQIRRVLFRNLNPHAGEPCE